MIPCLIHGMSHPIPSQHRSPGKLGGNLLVLKSVDGITREGKLMTSIEKTVATDVLDPCFIPYVLRHRIRAIILNGSGQI